MSQGVPSALIVLVYQWEAGFLQGVTLRRGVPPSQEEFDGIAGFSRLRARGRILGGAFDEVRWASVADVPFARLSASPFSLDSLAVRVSWRWLSPFCAGSP